MTCRQLNDSRVSGQSPHEVVAKHRNVTDHGWPERIDQDGGPHVRHHVSFLLVYLRDDLGHTFRGIAARALVYLLCLSDADTVFRIATRCNIEHTTPVS